MIRQSIEKTSKTLKLQLKTLKSRLKSLNSLLKKINVEYISEKEKRFKHQLKRENILYDYNSFQNIELIDGGSFGTIYCASSKHHQELVALKSINIDHSFEQLLNEAKQHCRVEHHSNILGFYGITKENKSITSKCIIVAIILGERETIIKGTPKKYAEIYTACWQGKPDLRPHIHEVMRDLDNVDITNTIEDIVNLTDQTNNELQIDGLNNHLKEDKLQNDLLYSTELLLSA
ncbi:10061_t:CDS:2 [Entrophospora sp. SA101]|nr:10061_t:CDS:2 [Entrophospora sp. SA101]